MRYKYYFTIAVLMAVGLAAKGQGVSNDNEDRVNKIDSRWVKNDYVPGQVLMKFKDANRIQVRRAQGQLSLSDERGVISDKLTSVLQKYGANEMEQLLPNENPNRQLRRGRAFNGDIIQERDLSQLYVLKLSAEHQYETMQIINELNVLDEVEYAEPNYYCYIMGGGAIADDYGNNPMVNKQWYLDAYGVTELWDKPIINSERPVIAVIDTGVDTTHPDLKDNCIEGYDFVNNTNQVIDDNMHGTHVAGIAAACNNETGIVGANPRALIMPIKVLNKNGMGNNATVLRGVSYAVEHGAKILNLSLGGYGYSKAAADVYRNASLNAIIVAAAGNDGKCLYEAHSGFLKHGKQPAPCFPGAYSFVLGVQATNQQGELASFSNYDDDGPLFSCEASLEEPDGFNYEVKAPGTEILSTLPNGNYGILQGTSMASPLVAGSISALMMVKQYDSQYLLWAELTHSNNIIEAFNIVDIPSDLDVLRIMLRERKEFENETAESFLGINEVKAGEIVNIYPIVRCTYGDASNLKLKIDFDENEDPNIVQILTEEVDFGWHLDAMGKAVSKNPLIIKISDNIANDRKIRMRITLKCDGQDAEKSVPIVFVSNNMEILNGVLSGNKLLTADKVYYVEEGLTIPEGVTMTIEPGTRIEFAKGVGLTSLGKIIAKGTKEAPITFASHKADDLWSFILASANDTLSYCHIEGSNIGYPGMYNSYPYLQNCIIMGGNYCASFLPGNKNVIMENNGKHIWTSETSTIKQTNFVNNLNIIENSCYPRQPKYSDLYDCNYFNNPGVLGFPGGLYEGNTYYLAFFSNTPAVDKATHPSYLGTGREDLVRPYVYELGNSPTNDTFGATYGVIDLSNMRTTPISEAHGIVWKILVNDKDPQDEYEELAPLGVGKHKFEVYFNRPMNKAVEPQISFGVRDPWTQNAINEDGSWNNEGTIYTAYKTITGKTSSDGVNRIYVRGAEDNEFFPCPYEKTRFNINVQAAGSMATGFAAEASLGRVNLTWDNSQNDMEDAMGYNVYRYSNDKKKTIPGHYDEKRNWIEPIEVPDTIRINEKILGIETYEYTDYNVIPNHTYYYLYKVLSTDLREYDISNIVAATPLTATMGDANGSGEVDVADVVTTVNYAVGMKPDPFIFDAADMNSDKNIDVLDVIGIVQKVLNPNGASVASLQEYQVVYTVENNILFVESPIDLAGIQVQLSLNERCKKEDVRTSDELKGFELASAWLTDDDYLLLAYSMSGKTLSAGKHALLYVGDSDISQLRISDVNGHNVTVIAGDGATQIDVMGSRVQRQEGIYDLYGRKLSTLNSQFSMMKKGVYIINGKKVVK